EADTAKAELAQVAAGPAAVLAAVALANRELLLLDVLGDDGGGGHSALLYRPTKGMPSSRSRNIARSSLPAVVVMVMFIPLGVSTLLRLFSGKFRCSCFPF